VRRSVHLGGTCSALALGALCSALFAPPSVQAATEVDLAQRVACPGASDAHDSLSVELRSMRCLLNLTRRGHGLAPLRASALLHRSAALRAEAIRRCGDFSHRACGQPFLSVFDRVGYLRARRASVGENLAWGSSGLGSPLATLQAWLCSPRHRSMMLGRWREVGVAFVHTAGLFGMADVTVWVADFGRRR
jgi:uncharacterized protein YkwD